MQRASASRDATKTEQEDSEKDKDRGRDGASSTDPDHDEGSETNSAPDQEAEPCPEPITELAVTREEDYYHEENGELYQYEGYDYQYANGESDQVTPQNADVSLSSGFALHWDYYHGENGELYQYEGYDYQYANGESDQVTPQNADVSLSSGFALHWDYYHGENGELYQYEGYDYQYANGESDQVTPQNADVSLSSGSALHWENGELDQYEDGDLYQYENGESHQVTSQNADEFLSPGSALHEEGRCRPCAFVRTEIGCKAKEDCRFCHYEHVITRARLRPCKGKRMRLHKLLERLKYEVDEYVASGRPMFGMSDHLSSLELPPMVQNNETLKRTVFAQTLVHMEETYGFRLVESL